MKKTHMICTLMMLGALLMSMSTGAAEYLVTGFETTDDAGYVLDSALPLDTTLNDSAKWGLAIENSDPPVAIVASTGDVTIKAPASTAAEWGSQCMEYYCLGTGSESSGMKLIEYDAMSAGVNKLTWQCDLRFIGELPGNQFFMRLQKPPSLYANGVFCNLNAQGPNTVFLFASGGLSVSSDAGSLVLDTDYQCAITFDDKDTPSVFTDDEVTCKVIKDPYGTPETILDTTASPLPVKNTLLGLPVAISMHGNMLTFCRVQIDNVSFTTGDTAIGDWMMFD